MSAKLDLLGHKYGKLTVIQSAGHIERGQDKRKRTLWLCRCDCGNTLAVTTDALRTGNTTSCGCGRIVDITGNKYGKLTVIRHVKDPSKNCSEAVWLCSCECGKEIVTRGTNLRDGATRSCGCLIGESNHERFALPDGVAAMHQILRRSKANAAERGYEWDLTKEQAIEIMQQNCHYCGLPPSNISRHPEMNGEYVYGGIDRVDNTKGYIIGNLVPCCKHCNIAKRDRSVEDFFKWIERVYNHSVITKNKEM